MFISTWNSTFIVLSDIFGNFFRMIFSNFRQQVHVIVKILEFEANVYAERHHV